MIVVHYAKGRVTGAPYERMRPEKENGVTHELARKKLSLLYCGTGLLSSRHMCLALCTTKANSATGKRLNMACTCYAEGGVAARRGAIVFVVGYTVALL